MKKSGFYWHGHHDVLMEHCYDYDERKDFILIQKPESERELRLRLFQPVKGVLPEKLLKAQTKHDKAWTEHVKAEVEHVKACAEREKARAEYDKARAEHDKACTECLSEIEALHVIECPNCPWNGKTIF